MLEAVETIMQRLKLPINARKTRCVRCPEEPFEFLGYRIGRNFRPCGRGSYIETRPSKKSVQSICRRISEQTAARHGLLSIEEMVTRLNWLSTGWANYFRLGQVNPAYAGIDAHMKKRIRQWLCRKHKVQSGGWARFPHEELYPGLFTSQKYTGVDNEEGAVGSGTFCCKAAISSWSLPQSWFWRGCRAMSPANGLFSTQRRTVKTYLCR